jgi:PleD family two-component response regulator
VEALGMPNPAKRPSESVTVSAGIAESLADSPLDVAGWLGRADAALYEAKGGGRNRVVAYHAAAEAA